MMNEPCCFVCKAKDHMTADCPTLSKEASTPRYLDKPKEKTSVIPEASVLSSHPGPFSAEDQWQTVRVEKGKRVQKRKLEPENKGTADRTDVEDAADKVL